MAGVQEPPFQAQDPAEINSLIRTLEAHTKKSKDKGDFSVRKSTFKLPDGRSVDSWKMQDWDYKKANLPTYARGLFTRRDEKSGNYEIVVRGYDKFFNHGEVRDTNWSNIQNDTSGPYELSVKENGCIIFISALDDQTILVCSKHSTGKGAGNLAKTHSQAGEEWVEKHLSSVGKSKADLAKQLRKMNATAVAELCDDTFEEHVLAYGKDIAGLYLHGLNLNLPDFATYPHHLVDEFAQTWGFRTTMYITENNIDKVKSFLDEVAETGNYDGRDTEGFVIRCHSVNAHGIYKNWFFKYKFEEPYLMYRQWRECTRAVIAGKKPRFKKHRKITEKYLLYARRRFIADSSLTKMYNQNHGIIALRDDFLREQGITGAEVIRREIETGEVSENPQNIFLVPIATIGCGKTTLGVALCRLFGWKEYQNDNVQGKSNRAGRFVSAISTLSLESPVVYADRNNHQKRERAQFIADIDNIILDATFIALNWVHDKANMNQIRQKLRNRVLSRGDNHQTIQAGTKSGDEIGGIMDGFLKRFEPLSRESAPDNEFDMVIDLDPLAETRDNLETVISKLHEEYPRLFPDEMPSATELDDAIEWAMKSYQPETKHDLDFSNKNKNKNKQENSQNRSAQQKSAKPKKPAKLEYFSIRVPAEKINSILEDIFKDLSPNRARTYRQLQQARRLQSEYHVTLLHKAHASTQPASWANLSTLYETAAGPLRESGDDRPEPVLGSCGVLLERVVWDDRIVTFVVRLMNEGEQKWESVNKVAHITVGTVNAFVKPKESNDVLEKWLSGNTKGIEEEKVKGSIVLDGTVLGVLAKY